LEIACPLWSRRAVRDLIVQELGIHMPIRTVGKYLKRWGYTAQRPRRHAKDEDPEEVRAWLAETYPRLEARASKEGADIFGGDETGVAADEHRRMGYARQGQPATLEVPDSHRRINRISAISNTGLLRFMTYQGAMGAALFLVFRTRLLQTTTRKVFRSVDHLRAHEAAPVDRWLEAHRDRIEVFSLPRRAPELNPDEYLNKDLQGNVHEEGLPDSKETLRSQVQRWMRTVGIGHRAVGHHRDIGRQPPPVPRQERQEVGAANLLFPLEQALDIDRQFAASAQVALQRLDVGEQLALVITDAASVQCPVPHDRFEGRRPPGTHRFCRLDVVMPVYQHGRPPRHTQPIGVDDGVARRGDDAGVVQADAAQVCGEPAGAADHAR
jgi:hypothetical protein